MATKYGDGKNRKERLEQVKDVRRNVITPVTMTKDMKSSPIEMFLGLIPYTVPFGYEEKAYGPMLTKLGFQKDEIGNYWAEVRKPDGKLSETMFVAHMDTADTGHPKPIRWSFKYGDCYPYKGLTEANKVIGTDGVTVLGADDRAGMAVHLWMYLKKKPGLYYFFIGEERGCVGSSHVSSLNAHKHYKRCIAFDRRGHNDIIAFQNGKRCASSVFVDALAKAFKEKDSRLDLSEATGVYTDSAEFMEQIAECTNISIGYSQEHKTTETIDLVQLDMIARAAVEIDWDALPAERDPSKVEWAGGRGGRYWDEGYDDLYSGGYGRYGSRFGGTKYGGTGRKGLGRGRFSSFDDDANRVGNLVSYGPGEAFEIIDYPPSATTQNIRALIKYVRRNPERIVDILLELSEYDPDLFLDVLYRNDGLDAAPNFPSFVKIATGSLTQRSNRRKQKKRLADLLAGGLPEDETVDTSGVDSEEDKEEFHTEDDLVSMFIREDQKTDLDRLREEFEQQGGSYE